MKKLKQVIYIVSALSLLSLFGCATQISKQYINKKNNQMMERINVNALLRAKNKETKNKIVTIDTIFNPNINRIQQMYYKEYNKKTKESIGITWSLFGGRISKIWEKNNNHVEYFNFYKNGNLERKYTDTVSTNFRLTIGTRYEYDQDGNVTNAIDFDKKYTYGLKNLFSLLESKYGITDGFGVSQYKEYNSEELYWEVLYRDEKNFLKRILVHGIKGEITEKGYYNNMIIE